MKRLFAFLLCAVSLNAFAWLPATYGALWRGFNNIGYSTPSAACMSVYTGNGGNAPGAECLQVNSSPAAENPQWRQFKYRRFDNTVAPPQYVDIAASGSSGVYVYQNLFQYKCDALNAHTEGTGTATKCYCDAGFLEFEGQSCLANADWLKALNESADTRLVGSGQPSNKRCYKGVLISGSASMAFKGADGSDKFTTYGPYSSTGQTCVPGVGGVVGVDKAGAASSAQPSTCSGYWGQVNGVDTCIPKSAPVDTTTGTSSSGSSASKTESDGTVTTTKKENQTSCVGGECTTITITTITNSGGGAPSTSTSSETKPKNEFCAANPTNTLCKVTSDTPTGCKAGDKSLGCAEFGSPDSSVSLPTSDSGFAGIVAASFSSSAGCPQPLSFSIVGRTYAIEYGGICGSIQTYVAPLMLLAGVALAAFVFVGGFRS